MLDRAVALLSDLIAFPTVSPDSNLDMIACLRERFDALGAFVLLDTSEDGQKANLLARIGPDERGGILLSGHTDVVPVTDQDWATDPFEMADDGTRLFGRGTCDMKGFIAAAVALAETIDPARLTRPLWFAFTHDEETGCLGARHLVEVMAAHDIRPDIVIVGEPTEMRVIEGHKGCFEYSARFTGLEGHGSAPDAGVNAAEYAARYVARLLDLREDLKRRAPADSAFDPPWTTINIGRIAGGVAHNVIVGKAEVDWEMRPVQVSDADFVKSHMAACVAHDLLPAMRRVHPGAAISVQTIGEVVGLDPMPANAARDLVAELTGANACDLVAFGTEAGLFQSLGADVVVCGPGSIAQAHKPDEFVSREQLAGCCAMLAALARRMS